MKKNTLFTVFVLGFWLISVSVSQAENPENEIKVMDFDEFRPLLYKDNDTTYVVNFWATWCPPCIAEMPSIQKLYEDYQDKIVFFICNNRFF